MQKELISKSEFARRAGVSAAAVSKACREGRLKPAVEKGKVNASHEAAMAYLESLVPDVQITVNGRPVKADKPAPKGWTAKNEEKKRNGTHKAEPSEVPEHIEEYADMTIREVIAKFGTDVAFLDFLKALKEIEMIEEKRHKNQLARGELVERKFIERAVFNMLETAFSRLLTDIPAALTPDVIARVNIGGDDMPVEVEDLIREANSKALKATKAAAVKAFKDE